MSGTPDRAGTSRLAVQMDSCQPMRFATTAVFRLIPSTLFLDSLVRFKILVDGGLCRVLALGYSQHWSSDDSRLYFHRASDLRDGEELWSITREGGDERKVADLKPLHPIGNFFDVSPSGQIVWVQYRRGKHELWITEFPAH